MYKRRKHAEDKCHNSSYWLRELCHRSVSFPAQMLTNKNIFPFCQKTFTRLMHMSEIQTQLEEWQ